VRPRVADERREETSPYRWTPRSSRPDQNWSPSPRATRAAPDGRGARRPLLRRSHLRGRHCVTAHARGLRLVGLRRDAVSYAHAACYAVVLHHRRGGGGRRRPGRARVRVAPVSSCTSATPAGPWGRRRPPSRLVCQRPGSTRARLPRCPGPSSRVRSRRLVPTTSRLSHPKTSRAPYSSAYGPAARSCVVAERRQPLAVGRPPLDRGRGRREGQLHGKLPVTLGRPGPPYGHLNTPENPLE